MGKREIRPLATPKPLNRSSQKAAHVIRSWISTDVQNLVAIPLGVLIMHVAMNRVDPVVVHYKCNKCKKLVSLKHGVRAINQT